MMFKVGDRVIHFSGKTGTIYQISNFILVNFPDGVAVMRHLDGNLLVGDIFQVIRHLKKLERMLE